MIVYKPDNMESIGHNQRLGKIFFHNRGLAAIEKMAVQGKDVNDHFTKGKMMPPLKNVQRVNVDFTAQMLTELDKLAQELNISRQAVIKSFLRVAIDQHLLASKRGKRAS
jgi:hypothetical protein